jgi:hypothetical protein
MYTVLFHTLLLLQIALQPGVGPGLLYNTPLGLSVPCSVSPSVYTHLSQVHGHDIQPSHSWLFVSLLTAFHSSFFGISVSCILSIWPSHLILWHLINLTIRTLLTIRNIPVRFNHHLELITSLRLHKMRNVRISLTLKSVRVTVVAVEKSD